LIFLFPKPQKKPLSLAAFFADEFQAKFFATGKSGGR
jgi:hypothetical protein